jgi:hypothetical protein
MVNGNWTTYESLPPRRTTLYRPATSTIIVVRLAVSIAGSPAGAKLLETVAGPVPAICSTEMVSCPTVKIIRRTGSWTTTNSSEKSGPPGTSRIAPGRDSPPGAKEVREAGLRSDDMDYS